MISVIHQYTWISFADILSHNQPVMVQRSDLKLAIYDPNKPSHQSEHVQYSYFVVIQQKPY